MRFFLTLVIAITLGTRLVAQEDQKADPPIKPILRMNSDSPYLAINAMQFDRKGKELHAVGWNKRVQTWNWNANANTLSADPQDLLEVPIGPGRQGNVNAIAVSPGGRWVAVGGRSFGQHESAFDNDGLMWPAAAQSDEQWEAQGVIFAHDRQTGRTLRLQGTRGEVLSLRFVDQKSENNPQLVSLALEFDRQEAELSGTLRLWDVNDAKCTVVNDSLPKYQNQPPFQMTILKEGKRKAARVAVTWGDHTVRVWDTQDNQISKHQLVNAYAIATLPTGELVSSEQGAIGTWSEKGGFDSKVPLPDGRAPIQLETFQSGGKTYVLAVCFHKSRQLQMVLVDVSRVNWKIVSEFVPIGSMSARPSFAVSGESGVIAIAPNGDDTIRVFRLADLLDMQSQPHQVLKSSVIHHSTVEFLRTDDDLGLRLASQDPDGQGDGALDWSFDFNLTQGFIVSKNVDIPWKSSNAKPNGWRVQQTDATTIAVTSPNNETQTVTWPDALKWTAHAFVPPVDNQPALLAVAFNRIGEPVLNIYNAQTGERVRRLIAHSALIRGLSFEQDGQLLASVADDRTTRVWSLKDLTETIGKLGLLPGVVATMRDDKLVIDRFEPTTPAELKAVLQENDVIEHAVLNGKERKFPSAQHFYWLVSRLKPGRQLTLSIRRGDESENKTITVGQAVDERKPLFSLLFGRNADAELESRPWIGWSPVGPFESNNEEFEKLVGWHFNTKDAAQPADFVPIAQYRPSFFGNGLFKALIENDGPPDVWPPVPEISDAVPFLVDPNDDILPSDRHGHVVTRRVPSRIVVDVPKIGRDDVRIGLYRDKQKIGEFKRSTKFENEWEAPLDTTNWEPGPTNLRIVTDFDGDGKTSVLDQPIIIPARGPNAPPPPELPPEMPKIRIEVAQALREIIAGEKPSTVPVQVRFDKPAPVAFDVRFRNDGESILQADKPLQQTVKKGDRGFTQEVPLKPGENTLTVLLIGPEGVERLSNSVDVQVLRLPNVLELSAETGTNAFATVAFRVQSELALVHVRLSNNEEVLIDAEPYENPDPSVTIAATDKPDEWNVTIDSIPLEEGTNQLELMIWNTDGALQKPIETSVEWEKPLPPPPRIQLAFGREDTVDTYHPEFKFSVETDAKLKHVQVRHNGGTYLNLGLPLPVEGKYNFRPTLQLSQSTNRVELLVTDENGSSEKREIQLSVVHRAVRVVIDKIVCTDSDETMVPEGDGQYLSLVDPPSKPRWQLHGRLILPNDPEDEGRLQNQYCVKCWVNGFLQRSVIVSPHDAVDGGIPFQTDFILNRQAGNSIVLELPDAPDHPAILITDCQAPETRQKLHMFLVGLNERNGEQFVSDAKRAFQVTLDQAPAFNEVISYDPLIDEFDPMEFNSFLIEGLRTVRRQNGGEPSLDVILLYYRGIESSTHAGQFNLATRLINGSPVQYYGSRRLAQVMQGAPGAHLVMLDVQRPEGRPTDRWPSIAHLGVIRAIWLNPDPNDSPTLIGMISQVLPQASRIGRLVEELRTKMDIPNASSLDSQIPDELQDLILGDDGT